MGFNDHTDEEFNDFLNQLIDMGHLEDAALGITKLVISKGEGLLSEKQRYVFKKEVLEPYTKAACDRCSSSIPWSEMYDAATEHGLCNYCWHVTSKDD
ncbi:hypothetical protein [Rheinheimera sp.]|uniref:hypothetical protein n=1 Tax=Rheinheimera sp. TaxID=1869214 RepID=UPI003AF4F003